MIIQNAIKITENDKITYLISRHRHDFVPYEFEDGAEIFIDGGCGPDSYLRRGGNWNKNIEEFSLYNDTEIGIIRDKLLWGVLINGQTVWKPLKELSKDHLENILRDYKEKLSYYYVETIEYWIKNK
jgi:hypothetical protein